MASGQGALAEDDMDEAMENQPKAKAKKPRVFDYSK